MIDVSVFSTNYLYFPNLVKASQPHFGLDFKVCAGFPTVQHADFLSNTVL